MPGKNKSPLREYAEAILLALLLALFLRAYIVHAYKIPSGSMIPTLMVGDQILVDKLVYRFRKPHRGDVIVFKYPDDPSRDFIKRLIGLPGNKLEVKDRIVYINDEPLNEVYAFHKNEIGYLPTVPRDDFGPVIIPRGKYFMMGDNREKSMDSRWWGFLDERYIIGRAFIIYWSRDISRIRPLGIRWSRFGMLIN